MGSGFAILTIYLHPHFQLPWTAFKRCDLAAELPFLAVLRPSVSDPKQTPTTDRYQRGAYADPHKNPEKMVDGPSVIAPPLMMGYCLRLLQGVLRA